MSIQQAKEQLLGQFSTLKSQCKDAFQQDCISNIETIIHNIPEAKISQSDLFICNILLKKLFQEPLNKKANLSEIFQKPNHEFTTEITAYFTKAKNALASEARKCDLRFMKPHYQGAVAVINTMITSLQNMHVPSSKKNRSK